MTLVMIIKFLGLLFISGLWLFFYSREREWWLLCVGILGFLASVVQVTPWFSSYRDTVAGGYVVIVIITTTLLYTLGYHPNYPIR